MVQVIDDARRRPASGPGRIPPHNLEAEESLLGAMLLSRDAIAAAVEIGVESTDYYKPAHSHIHEAIFSLNGAGEPADPVTVAEELRRASLLDAIGGKPALQRIQASTPASANAGHYARIVNELALLRRLILVAGDIAEMGYDAPDDVPITLDRAESLVFEVAERRQTASLVTISDALQATLDQLESMYGGSEVTGVPTGYHDLDAMLLGLQPSNLIIIAARPSAGKCVAWDTPIVDPLTGALRSAAEVYRSGSTGGDVRVLALDDDLRIQHAAPSAFIDDGVKPVYRVRTRLGREVRTTSTHPFLTPSGWRPLSEIEVGARVAVPRRMPTFGRDALPEPQVVLLALLVGSADLADRAPQVRGTTPPIRYEIARCCSELGIGMKHLGGDDYRLVTPRRHAHPVIEMATRLCRPGDAAASVLPEAVFRLPKSQLACFLNRLFATGGWAVSRAAAAGCQIGFAAASEEIARQLQHLLLRFDVVARIRPCGTQGAGWQLEVGHSESLLNFAAEIGIFSQEEAIASLVAEVFRRGPAPSLDLIPIDSRETGDERAGSGSSPRGTAASIAATVDSTALQVLAASDVWWDEVVGIDFEGDEHVYDLTVPRVHNFVAGDVFVHNTAFALGAARAVALEAARPVLFFSLEMGNLELTKRLLAAEARVEARNLWTGRIPEADWQKVSHAVGRLGNAPLLIDDNPHCTVMEMRAKARRTRARHGDLGLIVVDYLQLMSTSGMSRRQSENRQVEISEISRNLKILARELDCPVMALSQLNRQLEYRQDKRPMLADLRESGSLEQDADVVAFIYRDEIYNPESDQRGTAEIIVAKHRNGPTGVARLAFLERQIRFENMARV